MNTTMIDEFTKLKNKKAQLETKLNQIKARIEEMEPALLDEFATSGIDNIRMNGRTVFPHKSVYAVIKDKQRAAQALKDAGFNDYVEKDWFNSNSVSALVREMINNEKPLPKEFEGIIEVGTRMRIRAN